MSDMAEGIVARVAAKIMHDAAVGELLWSVAGEERQECFRRAARAAIEAMREPTPGMIEAGEGLVEPATWRDGGSNGPPRETWQAMIDTALTPPAVKPE